MPKSAMKAPERPAKKARVDPPKLSASRVKGSPVPQKKAQPAKSSLKGKEKATTATAAAAAATTPAVPRKRKSKADKEAPTPLPSTFKVVAGSYEKLLYGLEGTVSFEADTSALSFHLKPVFIFPAHVSCIKAVAASPHGGKWLATGSADEIVKVWDLRRRKEIGGLMHHEGSITHLQFPSRSHLLSASEDGTLCLFRARDWAVLRALRGHKGRVNSVAVHPSGKVALSVGKDRTLRMWDLMRGKGCASTKLGKEAELVRWSSDGSLFVVQVASTIDVYTTDMNLLHTITHPARLHDVQFCKRVNGEGDVLLAGAEDKKLAIYALSTDPETPPRIIAEMTGHANRVKAIATLPIALPPAALAAHGASTTVVCTVSSDGKILLYDLAALPATAPAPATVLEIRPVAEYDSKGTRLTCVTVADGEVEGGGMGGKRKRAGGEEGGESGDGDEDEGEEEDEEAEWGGVGGAADVVGAADEGDSGWEDEAEEEGEVESD
ncbi:WD40-repeat-containing domain protein [Mycena alexandri]|uniref:WD40-repeat-containing domain protein n=1 Tax=Mycena alexandri TaxID=1745969 RepID=A0AAD6WWL4_9AGAR|nr:WD40-repeat-containing domain protein [Mycena alexandri]